MESKRQLGAAVTASPLLYLQSADLFALVHKRPLVAQRFHLCMRGFSTPPILCHYSRHNGGVVLLTTITPNAGGMEVLPRHHIERSVAW
jgi:hypothetical protein